MTRKPWTTLKRQHSVSRFSLGEECDLERAAGGTDTVQTLIDRDREENPSDFSTRANEHRTIIKVFNDGVVSKPLKGDVVKHSLGDYRVTSIDDDPIYAQWTCKVMELS